MPNSETARTFDRSSGNRLTAHDLGRFPSASLFDRLGRAVCGAGCLPRKELFEAWEMARRVRRLFRGGRVVDLAGGHGLLAQTLLLLDGSSESALVVDGSLPPSAARLHDALTREWPRLAGRVVFDESRIQDAALAPGDLVVSCHACGALTDEVLSLAASARARVAVLPCCHDAGAFDRTTLTGWLDPALAIDVARARRLEAKGYRVWTQTIPKDITPKNRLLLGAIAAVCLLVGQAPLAAQWPERPTAGGVTESALSTSSRVLCVADIFDALRSSRPYRAGLPVEHVLDIMRREVGTALDPACFHALRSAIDGAAVTAPPEVPAARLVSALAEDYHQAA